MITEIAILKIDPSQAEAFEKTFQNVVHILRRQPGYQKDQLFRAIERPEEYILTVDWDNVSDHKNFIKAPDYPDLDGALGQYVKDGDFAHYRIIAG